MKKGAPLFPSHLCVGIAKDESDGGEEITLSGAIATHNHVVFWGEGLNDSLCQDIGSSLYQLYRLQGLRESLCRVCFSTEEAVGAFTQAYASHLYMINSLIIHARMRTDKRSASRG